MVRISGGRGLKHNFSPTERIELILSNYKSKPNSFLQPPSISWVYGLRWIFSSQRVPSKFGLCAYINYSTMVACGRGQGNTTWRQEYVHSSISNVFLLSSPRTAPARLLWRYGDVFQYWKQTFLSNDFWTRCDLYCARWGAPEF